MLMLKMLVLKMLMLKKQGHQYIVIIHYIQKLSLFGRDDTSQANAFFSLLSLNLVFLWNKIIKVII